MPQLVRYFNDKGHFVLLGRADNCINIKGNKINTGNIEKLLLLHEKIDSAIVRGVKKKNGTLKLSASIVGNVSKKEIVEYLQQHLLPFEIPSSIQVQSKVKKTMPTKQITKIAILVAILSVMAQIGFPIPFSLVWVTLQTLAFMAVAIVCKPKMAAIVVSVYVLMGMLGMPIFSQFRNGIQFFTSASIGFAVSFIPATFLMSLYISVIEKNTKNENLLPSKSKAAFKITMVMFAITLFTAIVMLFGAFGFMLFTRFIYPNPYNSTIGQAMLLMVIPFLPGELIKGIAVMILYNRLIIFRKMDEQSSN